MAEEQYDNNQNYDGDEEYDDSYYEEEVVDIPDNVCEFIRFFYENYSSDNENKVDIIHHLYEETWSALTERFYANQRWPTAEVISPLCSDDSLFLTLYNELYYRHVYAKLKPTMEERVASYQNYCTLFNYILNNDDPAELELPHSWLWDIIDEFIYQYQSFSQCLSKPMSEEDLAFTQNEEGQKWNVHIVLNVLHSLIEKSNINAQLKAYKEGGDITHADAVAGPFGCLSLYKMLGYFSLIGLCRLHCLLGDYHQALHVLENVELITKTVSGVPACQITTYYYVGFAYLMLGRYQDSIRTFATVLQYIQRSKQYNRGNQFEQLVKKKQEQMYQLLAIAVTLQPQRIDEHLHSNLKDKYGDKLNKMQKGDIDTVKEMFKYSCAKFVAPVAQLPGDTPEETPYQLQSSLFLEKVRQQMLLIQLKSYLKLYTTMPISKLASFMKTDEATVRGYLILYKNKSQSLVWKEGPPASGTLVSNSDVDFYMDGDMIHVAATKVERRYGQYFLRHVGKFKNVNDILAKITIA